MNFNNHSKLEGKHAFLGASKYHWVNYDQDKLIAAYNNYLATERGTRLHAFAKEAIELGIKLPRSNKSLNAFVNDAIGYKMSPEQPLYYSDNCFGTADAISYDKGVLRIHDLKTGATPASLVQLRVYTALFCLEYHKKPGDIKIENRIYQSDQIFVDEQVLNDPAPIIVPIIDKIISFDKLINKILESG